MMAKKNAGEQKIKYEMRTLIDFDNYAMIGFFPDTDAIKPDFIFHYKNIVGHDDDKINWVWGLEMRSNLDDWISCDYKFIEGSKEDCQKALKVKFAQVRESNE